MGWLRKGTLYNDPSCALTQIGSPTSAKLVCDVEGGGEEQQRTRLMCGCQRERHHKEQRAHAERQLHDKHCEEKVGSDAPAAADGRCRSKTPPEQRDQESQQPGQQSM